MSIGQGDVLATPLQVANTTNVIANGGTLLPAPPRARRSSTPTATWSRTCLPIRRRATVPVDPSNLAIMRQAMEWGFEGPWLKWFKIPGLRVGGKTGTAEYRRPTRREEQPAHPRLVHRLRSCR